MPVKMGRADQDGVVRVNYDQCTACGTCALVCKGGPLYIKDGRLLIDYSRALGCIACGHCAAVCPQECIAVEGRDLTAADIIPLPPRQSRANYDQLLALLVSRRSMRDYEDRDVDEEAIDQILAAAVTAPMGIPPTDVKVLVFKGRRKVREFKDDMLEALGGAVRFFSGPMFTLLMPLVGKTTRDMIRTFLVPFAKDCLEKDKQGIDIFAYNAPLGMLFYGFPGTDATDAIIAATYAMVAAESLGLGSCMLGFPAPLLKRSKKLMAKYGIAPKSPVGIMVIFGYPAVEFRRAVKRRFAQVRYQ